MKTPAENGRIVDTQSSSDSSVEVSGAITDAAIGAPVDAPEGASRVSGGRFRGRTFTVGQMKLRQDLRSVRQLSAITLVPKSVISDLRTKPGYVPSGQNLSKLMADPDLALEPNDFRRSEASEPQPEPRAPGLADVLLAAPPDDDEQWVYSAKIQFMVLRSRGDALQRGVTESDALAGSPDMAIVRGRVLDAIGFEDEQRFALLDTWNEARLAGDEPGEELALSKLRAYVERVYGEILDDSVPICKALADVMNRLPPNPVYASVEKCLPRPPTTGPVVELRSVRDGMQALYDEGMRRAQATPLQGRHGLRLAHFLTSVLDEIRDIEKVMSPKNLLKSKAFSAMVGRVSKALERDNEARLRVLEAIGPNRFAQSIVETLEALA